MSNLRDIRRRLQAVENIKKITDAMERVAAARLRRAQAQAEQSRPYITKMKEILGKLAATEYSHPLFEQREVKKTALIVVAADRGLSGSYNSTILTKADKFLKNYTPENMELILFGRKGIDHYRRKHWPISDEFKEWGGKISFHEIQVFMDKLVNDYLSEKYDEIWLIYTHYISVMNREVICEKFLNIEKIETDKKQPNYIFEPNPTEIYSDILPRYCVTRLQTALHESYASELAARIVAMQTASKNSKEMISDLTQVRNKVRQEGITREIIEISSSQRL